MVRGEPAGDRRQLLQSHANNWSAHAVELTDRPGLTLKLRWKVALGIESEDLDHFSQEHAAGVSRTS